MSNESVNKKYNIGYVPGAFDLFHIGHLNLLKNSKAMCNHLIAGVLTDELIEHFKKKRPMVPFEERIAIVEAIKYVDEVIPVTYENTRKIDAWHQLHYDAHFSGNDHGPDWSRDIKELAEVGAVMEFLNYTKGVSSSDRKSTMFNPEYKGKLLMFGAGNRGRGFINKFKETSNFASWSVVGFLDNNKEIQHQVVNGYTVYGIQDLPIIVPDGMYTVVITVKNGKEEIKEQLVKAGVKNIILDENELYV